MELIKDTHYEGERPLFATHNLHLENVTIHTGESALKECSNIEAVNCRFEGKYPFWHNCNSCRQRTVLRPALPLLFLREPAQVPFR